MKVFNNLSRFYLGASFIRELDITDFHPSLKWKRRILMFWCSSFWRRTVARIGADSPGEPILCLIPARIISVHPGLNSGVKNDGRWIRFVWETIARGCGGGLHAPFNCITRPTFKRRMQNSRGAILQRARAQTRASNLRSIWAYQSQCPISEVQGNLILGRVMGFARGAGGSRAPTKGPR